MPRKEKKYHFIYKTTNLLSGKYYIGMHSTDDLDDGYLGSGKRLKYSINKYGAKNHSREILEFVESREELKKREEEIVTINEIAKKDCMNLKVGGEGGGKIWSEEHLQKMRVGASKWMTNQWGGDDFREMMLKQSGDRMKQYHQDGIIKYDTFTGRQHSEESKKKMSESSKGKGAGVSNSQYGTCWVTRDGVNKKIKKKELETFTQNGWVKGRKV